jgi:cell division protein FtsW (lipid II flippase)
MDGNSSACENSGPIFTTVALVLLLFCIGRFLTYMKKYSNQPDEANNAMNSFAGLSIWCCLCIVILLSVYYSSSCSDMDGQSGWLLIAINGLIVCLVGILGLIATAGMAPY